jgi:hypothetical protein
VEYSLKCLYFFSPINIDDAGRPSVRREVPLARAPNFPDTFAGGAGVGLAAGSGGGLYDFSAPSRAGGAASTADALRRHTEWLEAFRRDLRRTAGLAPAGRAW